MGTLGDSVAARGGRSRPCGWGVEAVTTGADGAVGQVMGWHDR